MQCAASPCPALFQFFSHEHYMGSNLRHTPNAVTSAKQIKLSSSKKYFTFLTIRPSRLVLLFLTHIPLACQSIDQLQCISQDQNAGTN